MPSAIANKILRNTGWNFFSRLIHIPISICLIPFIINQVGVEWYGVWVTLFALVDYFSLLDLGVGAATIKYVAEYHASQNIRKIGHVVLNTCIFNLIFFPPLALSRIFADEILAFFKIAPQSLAEAKFIFEWILLNFALSQFSSVFRNTLIGLQHIHVNNFCEIIYLLAYATATWIVLGSGAGLKGMIVVLFYLRCGMVAAQVLCVLRVIPQLKQGLGRIDVPMLKDFFRYGLTLQLNSLAGFLNFQLDKLLVGHFLKMEFVAFYEVGSKLAMVIRILPSMMLSPLIPASAELSVHRDAARLEELYLRGTKYLTLMAAPLMGFMVSMGPAIMHFWLGSQSSPQAVLALQILSIGYFFNIIAGAAHSIGRGIGILKYELQATGLITILNLLLSVTLVIYVGFAGALLGTGVAMVVGNLFYVVRFHRFIRTTGKNFLSLAIGKPLICACAAGVLTHLLFGLLGNTADFSLMGRIELLLYLCGTGIFFLGIFIAGLLLLKVFTRADVEMIDQFWVAIRTVRC
jgi:O-antigen/teichoic acid export membrane protein